LLLTLLNIIIIIGITLLITTVEINIVTTRISVIDSQASF